jgi:hypothetical protein
MHDTLLASLQNWTNFYVIVGSSAGALTGLQFVVIALVAEARMQASLSDVRAFGSPTVVHFCAVLFISATATAPWPWIVGPSLNLALCGAAGVGYILNAIRHARRPTGYQPDGEDWFWYAALPLASYFALFLTGLCMRAHVQGFLFLLAGIALVLLYTGIRNAWDSVTYIAVTGKSHGSGNRESSTPSSSNS